MANLTLKIDDDIIKKARKVAIDKNTTVTALVRNYLQQITFKMESSKDSAIRKLRRSFTSADVIIGDVNWKREDLHER